MSVRNDIPKNSQKLSLFPPRLKVIVAVLILLLAVSFLAVSRVGAILLSPKDYLNNPALFTTGDVIYISAQTGGSVNGLSFSYGDILAYDTAAGSWSIYFDGDDVSFCCNSGKNLDAFHMLSDGSLLLSLNSNDGVSLPNVGLVDDSDIVRFIPTSLGENTAGTYEFYFDGSDVGLSSNAEDIVSISVLADDSLIISLINGGTPSGMGSVEDEDLLRFVPTSLGSNTSGTWEMFFDGSDVGLGEEFGEGVMGAWIDPVSGDIYLATRGTFNVPGLSGDEDDIFRCVPITLGDNTACTFDTPLYWEGELFGFAGEAVSGLHLQLSGTTPPPTPTSVPPTPTMTPTATPNGNEEIHINFQLDSASVPAGMLADGGASFADRGNGYNYGWDSDNTGTGRDRDSSASPDQRYDTLLHMQHSSNPNAEWEIALPDGTYEVHLVAGDPDWLNSNYVISAEGVTIISGAPTSGARWLEGTVIVAVSDGRLTISNGSASNNNKINFIDIVPVTTPPTSSIAVTSLTLVNADTNEDIGILHDGDTLDLANLPTTNLNVRADVSGSPIGSVRFEWDGNPNFSVENDAPYALAGDNNGNYYAWTPTLGAHLLRAVPYTAAGGGGSEGLVLQVALIVVSDTPPGRVTADLEALYTFTEGNGTTVYDVSGITPALDLTIADAAAINWLPNGGLSVITNTIISSNQPATRLIDAAKSANAMTFEAWVKPANIMQEGPARIVTISADSGNRNMTLGQQYDHLSGRVRTTATSNNGLPGVSSAAGSVDTELQHFVWMRHADGTRSLYINGGLVATDTSVGGNLSNWNNTYYLALANEFVDDRAWLGEFYLVAVYGRALNGAEVAQNFNAGPGGTPIDPPTPTPTFTPTPTNTPVPPTVPPPTVPPPTVTPGSIPDLAIGKSGPSSASAGDLISYTLSITNNGSVAATNVVVTDTLPQNVKHIQGGIINGEMVTWQIPVLPANSTAQVEFYVVATAADSIVNNQYGVTADGLTTAVVGQAPVVTIIQPTADFEAWPHVGTVPLTVTFDNQSLGSESFLWDFGDGQTSTEITPTHVYTAPGDYTVTLTATNVNGSDVLVKESFVFVEYAEIPYLQILPERSVIFESPGQTYQFNVEMVYPDGWPGPVVSVEPGDIIWTSSDDSQVQINSTGWATVITSDAYALIIASLNFDPGFPYNVAVGSMMVADVHDSVIQLEGNLVTNQLIIEEEGEHKIILEVVENAQTSALAIGDTVMFGDVAAIIVDEKFQNPNSTIILQGTIPGLVDIFNALHVDISSETLASLSSRVLAAQSTTPNINKSHLSAFAPNTGAQLFSGGRFESDRDCGVEVIYEIDPTLQIKFDISDGKVKELRFIAYLLLSMQSLTHEIPSLNIECLQSFDLPLPNPFLASLGPITIVPELNFTIGFEAQLSVAESATVEVPGFQLTKSYESTLDYTEENGYHVSTDSGETEHTIELNLISFDEYGSVIEIDGSMYIQAGLDWKVYSTWVFQLAEIRMPALRLTVGRHFVFPTPLNPADPHYQGPTIEDRVNLDLWPLKEISFEAWGRWFELLGVPPLTVEFDYLKKSLIEETYAFPGSYDPALSDNPIYISGDESRGFPDSTTFNANLRPWTNPILPNPVEHTEIWRRNVNESTTMSYFQDGESIEWTPEPGEAGTYQFKAMTYYDPIGSPHPLWSLFPNASPIATVTVIPYADLMVEHTPVKMDVPVFEQQAKQVYVTNNSVNPISFSFTNIPAGLSITPSGTQTIAPGENLLFIFEYACSGLSTKTGALEFNVAAGVTWEPVTYELNCVNFRLTPPELIMSGNTEGGQASGRFFIHNTSNQVLTWVASHDLISFDPPFNSVGLVPDTSEPVVATAKCPSFGIHRYQVTIEALIGGSLDSRLYDVVLDCTNYSENGVYLNDTAHTGFAAFEKSLQPPLVETYHYPTPVGYDPALTSPLVTESYFYMAYIDIFQPIDSKMVLQAFHKESGALAWQTEFITHTIGGFIADDNVIYMTTRDFEGVSYLHALSATSGNTIWMRTIPSYLGPGTPTVDKTKVFVVGLDGDDVFIYAYDKATGDVVWQNAFYIVEGYLHGNPIIVNDTLAFYTSSNHLYALDKNTGSLKWVLNDLDLQTYLWDLVGDTENNRIYAFVDLVSPAAGIQAIDADTGETIWLFDEYSRGASTNLVLADGKIYHLNGIGADNFLYVWDAISGTLESQYQVPYASYSFSFMTVANNVVYASTYRLDESVVIAYSPETGEVLWKSNAIGPNHVPITVSDGKLYVSNGDGIGVYESAHSLSGYVLDGSIPMVNIPVKIVGSTGKTTTVVTDADGYYEANDLVADEYTVTPLPANNSYGFLPESQTATLPPGITDLNFTLRVSDPPDAVSDNATVYMNGEIDIYVLENDTDPDGDFLEVGQVTQPTNGTAVIAGDEYIVYTPDQDFVGTDSFVYTVSDNKGGEDSTIVQVTVLEDPAPGTLPLPWQSVDIGDVSLPGTTSFSANQFHIEGNGLLAKGNSHDAFHFMYQTLTGDGTIIARITSQSYTDFNAKAGLMIREDLSSDSDYLMAAVTPSGIVGINGRVQTGVSSYDSPAFALNAPVWVKLVRKGSNVNVYFSYDGVHWNYWILLIKSFPSTVYVGLAVSSNNATENSTAIFDKVHIR